MSDWVLDLFCCAGGAARGYQRVDIVDRPNYCGDAFIKADALVYLRRLIGLGMIKRFKLAHASPPCQEGNPLTRGTNRSMGWGREHVQLVPETRQSLDWSGLPYVIEQPTGSGVIRRDLMLCMDMFPVGDPPWVQRHREFELSGFDVEQPKHAKHRGYVRGMRHGVVREGPYVAAYGSGGGKATVPEMQQALGIDWTDVREELTEAIPPAYTEYIGRAFRESGEAIRRAA